MKRQVVLMAVALLGGCNTQGDASEAGEPEIMPAKKEAPTPEAGVTSMERKATQEREGQTLVQRGASLSDAENTVQLVKGAADTVRQMRSDAKLKNVIAKSKACRGLRCVLD